jgi:toxin-antitoxin system PIN domain toxin
MRCVDVNVLVYAHRSDSPQHAAYLRWLDKARVGVEPLGLCDVVASGFLRVVTHPRIFREPTDLATALTFLRNLRLSTAVLPLNPGERHLEIFEQLCIDTEASGNRIPDAFLAAVAIEHNATWITADRGFARYRSLQWMHPLDDR